MSDSPIPKERGSVRSVTIDGDSGSFMCEVRAASWRTGLQIGALVWVNFGTQNRIEDWRECEVLPSPEGTNTASGVHVRPVAAYRLLQVRACHCLKGFVCALHPDQPMDHPGCDHREGVKCPNPECPYWVGDQPMTTEMFDEEEQH